MPAASPALILAAAPPAAAPSTLVGTVLEMVVRGGWVMVPITICSLVALAIILERWLTLRRGRIAPAALAADIATHRASSAHLGALARGSPTPLGRVLAAYARHSGEDPALIERRVAEAAAREVLRFRRHMRLLSAMAPTATMLGLLGTVFGMIRTFTTIAASGDSLGKTERLAQGIYEAWTATAAGLAVAIPVLIAYHMLMARVDAAAAMLDETISPLLDAAEPSIDIQPRAIDTNSSAAHAVTSTPAASPAPRTADMPHDAVRPAAALATA